MLDINPSGFHARFKQGQALLEWVVVMVVVLVLLAALLQIGRLARGRSAAMAEARAMAGAAALSLGYPSPAPVPPVLRTWRPGPDGRWHSRDDIPAPGSAELIRRGVLETAHPDRLGAALRNNPLTRADQEPDRMNLVHGLVQGRSSPHPIPMLPIARRLLYDAEAIAWEGEVWMVWMRGIY